MLIGVIADDFTGASDIANNLTKGWRGSGGLATTQFLGVPRAVAEPACEAGVVALKTRSIPASDAVARSLDALRWLQAQGCGQIVFKYCSTFDSTPAGNIGPVAEALAEALGVSGVPACPAFPEAGRTVYQGHLFVWDRLLSESSLATHPLNPMTDPDLRRWLARQTTAPVGLVRHAAVRAGAEAVRVALDACAEAGERLAIVDALDDDDLAAIGRACADKPLITGGSGIALGLPGLYVERGLVSGRPERFRGIPGPEAILSGSCSQATLAQVERHGRDHPTMPVAVEAVMAGRLGAADIVAFVRANAGRAPLVYSSDAPERVAAAQKAHGAAAVAAAIEELFAAAARDLVAGGLRRLVVAGGETSGAVVSALGIDRLEIGPEIDPGVPVVAARHLPLALALKSGNFGAVDFFTKALGMLEAAP